VASPPRALDDAAAWSWRLLVVGAAILATVLLLARLRLVVLPLFVAILLATALRPVARFLEQRRIPKGFATLLAFLAFFAVLGAIGTLVGKGVGNEVEQVGPTISKGIDDVQRWLVEGPLSLEQAQIDQFRQRATDSAREAGPGLIAPAVAVVEVLAGILLALITSFFLVKDGPELEEKALRRFPERHRARAKRAGRAARRALGGYLKGAATLGAIEGVIIAVTIVIVGGRLAIPVLLLTFIGAFIPVVGAILSGTVAALVTLVTAGPREALIVAVVALVVQQLDNDLLAPFIYGRSVSLHPLAILLSIATGATLGGLAGTFLAVPVLAMIVAVAGALRQRDEPAADPEGDAAGAPPGDGHVAAPVPAAAAPPPSPS
jgi:predicted PurR-regulated permease PerM